MRNLFMKFMLVVAAAVAVSFTNDEPGTTIGNLQNAYMEEANSVKKFEQYSVKASEEGYNNVAKLLRAVSKSESVHMNNHREAIEKMGGTPEKVIYEKVKVKSTKENLKRPIRSQAKEAESIYPDYIKTAKADNAKAAVKSFTYAMSVEKSHEMFLNEALANLGKNIPENYYVSNVTGEIVSVKGSEPRPKAKLKGEKFIMVN